MADSSENNSLRDVLRLIFRRRYFFLIGSALLANVLLLACLSWPVKYTGTTKFRRRTDAAVTEARNQPESFETIKLTLREELIGQQALETVVEQLGLTRGQPRDSGGKLTREGEIAKEGIVKIIGNGVNLEWEVRKESLDLVSLSVTHSDSRLAYEIPTMLVKNYISGVQKRMQEQLTSSLEHLKLTVAECANRLREQTNRRITFEEEHAGMMPDRPGNLEDRIQQTIADLERERRGLDAAKLKLARLESRWRDIDTDDKNEDGTPVQEIRGPNPELERLRRQLDEYEDALEAATVIRTDQHPDVIALKEKIADLHEKIAREPAEVVLEKIYALGDATRYGPEIAGTAAEIKIKKEAVDRLEDRHERLAGMLSNFAPIRQEYEDIIRREQKLEKQLEGLDERAAGLRERLANEVAGRGTHLTVVQPAKEQFRPSTPKLFMVLALSILGGLGGGTGLVFLTHTLDRSVATTDEASEHFGLRVHGVIGEIITPTEAARRRMIRWTVGPTVGVILVVSLMTAGVSNILRLKYPEKYHSWKASPVGFVFQGMSSDDGDHSISAQRP